MNRKLSRGEWAALLACLLLIAGIFATGALGSQKVWANIALDGMQAELRLDAGDAYGEYGGGPYFDLPAGTYRLRWRITQDGANLLRFSCSNDVTITPGEVRTDPSRWEDEVCFTLEETAHYFSITVDFCDGTALRLDDLRLYSPVYTDGAWTAALLLLGAWLLAVIWRRIGEREGRCAFALLAFAVVFSSLPMLKDGVVMAADTQFHGARLMNLADALASGQVPARLGGFSYNGYGAVTSVFYPDVLLYPLALMLLGGASVTFVMQVFTVLIGIATAAIMYAVARRVLGGRPEATCAAILYVLANYRIERLYNAFMLGQIVAMAVLPLFLLGLWEVCRGDARRWPLLTAGATLIFQSHMLTTLMCAGMAVLAVLVRMKAMLREHRLGALFKAAALTLMLNLFTLVPMATLYLSGVNTGTVQFGFAGNALELHRVLLPDGLVGLPMLLALALLAGAALPGMGQSPRAQTQGAQIARIGAVCGAVCVLLSTQLIPWNYVVKLTAGLVEVLQFPWRFLAIAAVMLALCGGFVYPRVLGEDGMRAAALVLALCMLCVGPYLRQEAEDDDRLGFGEGANPYMVYPEYQIEGTDVHDTRSRAVLTSGDVQVTDYVKEGTRVSCTVNAQSDAELTLPLFGFAGYEATLEGRPLAVGLGENNRLTVSLPAGVQGALRVRYVCRPLWRVCDAVSLLTLLAAAGAWIVRRRRRSAVQSGSSCAQ